MTDVDKIWREHHTSLHRFIQKRVADKSAKNENRFFIRDWAPASKIEDYVVSAAIETVKPAI